MRGLSTWLLGLFANPAGLIVLAALDSTIFFFFPLGIDAVVIMVSARSTAQAWLIPLLATAGSLAGAALSFWMGIKIGDAGLERYTAPKRLARVRRRVKNGGAMGLAVLDLIPPPFPFTAFVLAAGALEVDSTIFFTTLAGCRLLRFGIETALAVRYGHAILGWMESDLFQLVLALTVFTAVAISVVSLLRTFGRRSAHRARA